MPDLTNAEIIHIYENSNLFGPFSKDGMCAAYVAGLAALRSAEPVRHGRWEPIGGDTNRPMCACTQCWEETAELECREYCGNCGAKMDADQKGGPDLVADV
ncbi:hypothetical protein ACH6CV_16795 [Bacillota bacterium Meth-B3]